MSTVCFTDKVVRQVVTTCLKILVQELIKKRGDERGKRTLFEVELFTLLKKKANNAAYKYFVKLDFVLLGMLLLMF